MRFEISERVITTVDRNWAERLTVQQFRKIAKQADLYDGAVFVEGIQRTFGSIQRVDTACVEIRDADDGYFIVAAIEYKPSIFFWIFFCVGIFGYFVGALLPVGIYIYHQRLVRNAVVDALSRVEGELRQGLRPSAARHSIADEIGKLAALKESGVITEEEFTNKKRQLLRT